MNVLITGASGYVGSVLYDKVLADRNIMYPCDIGWFGDRLGGGDFRDINYLDEIDCIIHLAAIANDPTGALDPVQTWKTNAFGTMDLAEKAAKAGVKQFIYASSGSVYGVSSDPQVTEESKCVPLSAYNETKKVAERCLLSYSDKMAVQIIRPATVCGLSPRMRLDLAVNNLTMQALTKGVIEVHGGQQYRPNIHIQDLTDLYVFMLNHRELTGIFNAGFENLKLIDIANKVASRIPCEVKIVGENDPRSYRMNSDKLLKTGFKQRHSVGMAISEISIAYKCGELKDEDRWYNIKSMPK